MKEHTCHAQGCQTPCPPERLCCSYHWWRIPHMLRQAVIDNYRHGQCQDRRPSRNWVIAARRALNYLALLEGEKQKPTILSSWDFCPSINQP